MSATPIYYSRGFNRFDNLPQQFVASDFDEFAAAVLADRSTKKGLAYVCAAMAVGHNNDQEKYPDENHWRAKHLAEPRAFLPFDFDGFDTPESFEEAKDWLGRYKGFGYTTASHTAEVPYCRIVLALTRATTREEGKILSLIVQHMIEQNIGTGKIKFDGSVYKAEQPLFTPLVNAEAFHFDGEPVDVDALLASAPPPEVETAAVKDKNSKTQNDREAIAASKDFVLWFLDESEMIKGPSTGNGKYPVICPFIDEHTRKSSKTSAVYYLPNFGGVKYGKFVCKHEHCEHRSQEDFLRRLGLDPHKIWREQARGKPTTTPNRISYGKGYFESTDDGVFFVEQNEDFEALPPILLCSPISILAKTRDEKSGEWGRLLEWVDSDNVMHQWAMPIELLQGDGADVRRELARLGLVIAPGRKARDLLASYIQIYPVEDRARCVDKLGWHGSVYVRPFQVIGAENERIVYQSAHPLEPSFGESGTSEEWRDNVAALAIGNSRLAFAFSAAFAGPLVEVVREESGGFHYRGGSSTGKTTAIKAATSVLGNPSTYIRLWRATANGLEGLAAIHNDGLLVLDELSQIDPKEAGEAAYLLANGQGKARASRTGAAKQSARWRIFFLSSGEESLTALMARAGKKANAGQEVRLADIDADAGANMGIFEDLHGYETPGSFATALKDASSRYYGSVGSAWLHQVVEDRSLLEVSLPHDIKNFVDTVVPPNASGQVIRVAQRFALVAAAGELATRYGLTGWPEGEAFTAAQRCFNVWLESFGGAGNKEERTVLAQVKAFFETNGTSRFQCFDKEVADLEMAVNAQERIINRAGFYQMKNGFQEFIALPEAYKRDVCAGFDYREVTKILLKHGWIIPDKNNNSTQKPRLPGLGPTRCYVFSSKMWRS